MLVYKTSYMWKRLYFGSCYMQLWNAKYLSSIIYDSAITFDEIIDAEAKSHGEEKKLFQQI